jgi:2,3-bisphosphoglycerate-dependent phosphoglycerate mutase
MNRNKWIVFLLVICFGWVSSRKAFSADKAQNTTLFLVRHAEKVGDGSADPALTPEGTARAQELAYILQHVKLDAVYSTPYIRTKNTALPTAQEKGLEIRLYEPHDESFILKVLDEFAGGKILIVGHSNTIPALVNQLPGSEKYRDLPESTYDNLFVVSMPAEGQAVILRLRFGQHTPEK